MLGVGIHELLKQGVQGLRVLEVVGQGRVLHERLKHAHILHRTDGHEEKVFELIEIFSQGTKQVLFQIGLVQIEIFHTEALGWSASDIRVEIVGLPGFVNHCLPLYLLNNSVHTVQLSPLNHEPYFSIVPIPVSIKQSQRALW